MNFDEPLRVICKPFDRLLSMTDDFRQRGYSDSVRERKVCAASHAKIMKEANDLV